MQRLKTDRKYIARWAHYDVVIQSRSSALWDWHVEGAPDVPGSSGSTIMPDTAILRAANFLMELGCFAVVSGVKKPVAEFLCFEEVADAGS